MKKQKIFFIIADILLITLSIWLAFVLRFDGNIPRQFYLSLQKTIILALVFHIFIFCYLGLYSFSWSYVSTRELISLFIASSFSFLFLTSFLFLLDNFSGFPRSTLFTAYFLVLLSTGGLRLAKRIYLQVFKENKKDGERILIIGAGDAGEQVLRNINGSSLTPYFPVGFIDDDPSKKGNYIHGIKVFGGIEDMGEIIQVNNISGTMIAFPSADASIIKKAVG
jgi:FlaA1/EpsC-like NDP-sugar epimerase